ncbi:molybdate ABC transporter substrate-binding protein [Hoeflea poritis]|uniref:Molybdate ABC transporter substrate-binding protein n=1 Tax=Hoeflea poritis TaxID=2993659 RepID=A0ABT4VR80_9HYPH|nr:molybdate ABC transporter substrate-binding protein [Hoeflea poritis]MDA4847221.1 molybdate ABC transporter substrate-binding protein [Hoeflea poritis]
MAALFLTLLLLSSAAQSAERTLVFAAASMKDAVEAMARAYRERTGNPVVVSVASSGALARQIEAGAPADLFIAANPDWMDYLEDRKLIDVESRTNIAGNTLVVVTGDGAIAPPVDPEPLLRSGRFAMGDPAHVPAGVYTAQALDQLGLWEDLRPMAAFGENVRVAMALAARGDVAFAIVYGSDAELSEDVAVAYIFPPETHAPIVYPAALTANAHEDARDFYAFLRAQAADGALGPYGFTKPAAGSGS